MTIRVESLPAPTVAVKPHGRLSGRVQKALTGREIPGTTAAGTARGTAWGRSAAGLAALFLLVVGAAAGQSWADDTASERVSTPDVVPLNLAGQAWIGVAPVEFEGELWLEVRMSSGAYKPTDTNGFQALAAVVDHKYFRLTVGEIKEMENGLRSWLDTPHSDTVFRVPGEALGFAITGNAWSETLAPVVVVQITCWIPIERGQVHGGQYVTLDAGQATALADALDGWLDEPAASNGLLFQQLVQ